MKVKYFCSHCADDNVLWKIFVPNENYTDGESDDQYDMLQCETVSGVINVFGERIIDSDHKGVYFGTSAESPYYIDVNLYLKGEQLNAEF